MPILLSTHIHRYVSTHIFSSKAILLASHLTPHLEYHRLPIMGPPTPNCIAWVGLPGAYTSASIAHPVMRARRTHHHVEVRARREAKYLFAKRFL
jgi:hypothetical protein